MLGKINEEFLRLELESKKFFNHFYAVVDDDVNTFFEFVKSVFSSNGFEIIKEDLHILTDLHLKDFVKSKDHKPVKFLVKARKKVKTGVRYAFISYLSFFMSFSFLVSYLFIGNFFNSTVLLYASFFTLLVGVLNWLVKGNASVVTWFKAIGLMKGDETKMRLFLSTNSTNEYSNEEAKTSHEMIYNDFNKSFLKSQDYKEEFLIQSTKMVDDDFKSINVSILDLEVAHKNGRISDSVFEKKMSVLEKKKASYLIISEFY